MTILRYFCCKNKMLTLFPYLLLKNHNISRRKKIPSEICQYFNMNCKTVMEAFLTTSIGLFFNLGGESWSDASILLLDEAIFPLSSQSAPSSSLEYSIPATSPSSSSCVLLLSFWSLPLLFDTEILGLLVFWVTPVSVKITFVFAFSSFSFTLSTILLTFLTVLLYTF